MGCNVCFLLVPVCCSQNSSASFFYLHLPTSPHLFSLSLKNDFRWQIQIHKHSAVPYLEELVGSGGEHSICSWHFKTLHRNDWQLVLSLNLLGLPRSATQTRFSCNPWRHIKCLRHFLQSLVLPIWLLYAFFCNFDRIKPNFFFSELGSNWSITGKYLYLKKLLFVSSIFSLIQSCIKIIMLSTEFCRKSW